jgi:hypothetical protein
MLYSLINLHHKQLGSCRIRESVYAGVKAAGLLPEPRTAHQADAYFSFCHNSLEVIA